MSPTTVRGLIALCGLSTWWTSELTVQEQHVLEAAYEPFGLVLGGPRPDYTLSTGLDTLWHGVLCTPAGLLSNVLQSVPRSSAALRRKILRELERLSALERDPLARHFELGVIIEETFRGSQKHPASEAACEHACRAQIALADEVAQRMHADGYPPNNLPRHLGYEYLVRLRRRHKRFTEAAELEARARSQGWRPDPRARRTPQHADN